MKVLTQMISLYTMLLFLLTACMQTEIQEVEDPNTSPFEQDKVLLSRSLLNSMGSSNDGVVNGSSQIPATTNLGVVVNDKCIVNRFENPSPIKFYVDKYIDINDLKQKLVDNPTIEESIISIKPKSGLTIDGLNYLVKLDKCIVGISDLQNHEVNSALFNDPQFIAQKTSYLDAIGFEQADTFFKSHVPSSVKVNVAVIDSGYDMLNGDVANFGENLEGLNIFDQNSNLQDSLGHGTQVANVIAAQGNNGKGSVGIAHRNTKLIPVRAFKNASIEVHDGYIFDAIKRSVNSGAEIINLSFSAIIDREAIIKDDTLQGQEYLSERIEDQKLTCSPIIGHAIYRSLQRGVFIAMAAGHATSYEKYQTGEFRGKWVRYKDKAFTQRCDDPHGSDCVYKRPLPGSIKIPNDNGGEYFGNNSMPACWSRYYEGAVSVAALDKNKAQLAKFSNWSADGIFGDDGVEIAAPGEAMSINSLDNQQITTQGTSFSTPQVSAAATLIKAFFKHKQNEAKTAGQNAKEWAITPWAIESIILESSQKNELLHKSDKPVRDGRTLDLAGIAQYLSDLSGLDFAQRRVLASINDNTEIGEGYQGDGEENSRFSEDPNLSIIGFDVYAREKLVNNYDQIQMQAVAYFSNGGSEVITDKIQLKITSGKGFISPQNVLYPDSNSEGYITVEGEYKNKKSSFTLYATADNIISGLENIVPEKLAFKIFNIQCCYTGREPDKEAFSTRVLYRVYALYPDGSRRDISAHASTTAIDDKGRSFHAFANSIHSGLLFGGTKVKLISHYMGVKGLHEFTLPKASLPLSEIYLNPFSSTIREKVSFANLPKDNIVDYTVNLGDITMFGESTILLAGKPELPAQIGNRYFNTVYRREGETDWVKEFMIKDLPAGIYHYDFYGVYRGNGTLDKKEGRFTLEIKQDEVIDIKVVSDFNPTLKTYTEIKQFDDLSLPHKVNVIEITQNGDMRFCIANCTRSVELNGVPRPELINYAGQVQILTHKPGVQHHLVFTHKTLGKTIKIPTFYSGSSHKLPNISKLYRDPIASFSTDVGFLNWSLEKKNLANGQAKYLVNNQRQKSSQCTQNQYLQTIPVGEGSVADPKIICSFDQLVYAYENRPAGSSSYYLKLGDHIDLSTQVEKFEILRKSSSTHHKININGDGYAFKNLTIHDKESLFRGIFQSCPIIENIGFENITIHSAGGYLLCRDLSSEVEFKNIYTRNITLSAIYEPGMAFSGEISFIKYANNFNFKNLYLDMAIQASKKGMPFVKIGGVNTAILNIDLATFPGGHSKSLAGLSESSQYYPHTLSQSQLDCLPINSTIGTSDECLKDKPLFLNINAYVEAKILSTGSSTSVAGLFAYNDAYIANAHVRGHIESNGNNVAGIASNNGNSGHEKSLYNVRAGGYIIDSSFDGFIFGRDHVGGIVGTLTNGHLSNNTVSGQITGEESVGGLVGTILNFGMFLDNNVQAQVSSSGLHSGGLIGSKLHIRNYENEYFWAADIIRGNTYPGNPYGNNTEVKLNAPYIPSLNE